MAPHSERGTLASGGRRDAERLTSIATSADSPTIELLATLELPATATALDIGCGTGALASAIARDIVPGGSVIALDQDLSALDVDAQPLNTTVIETDVRRYAPPRPLDLIHARFVLAHLPDRNNLLDTIATWLAPGGHIVITEPAALPVGPDVPAPARTVFAAYHRWVRNQGMSFDFATAAPHILTGLGATAVTVHTRTSRFGGGPALDRWLPLITPIAHHLHDYGIDDEMWGAFAAAAAHPQTFVIPQLIVTTHAHWAPSESSTSDHRPPTS